jgi:Ca-activated chloride channel family protein
MRATTLALALCISALVSAPHAQSRFGVVTGKVTDIAGAPIPGATVRLTGQGQTPLTTASDPAGDFTFSQVPAGAYVLTVTLSGFRTATANLKVVDGQTARVPIALRVAAVSESVTVTSNSPTVDSHSTLQGFTGPVAPGRSRPGDIFGPRPAFNTEAYNAIVENPFLPVTKEPLSTFSIDVDTASYANVRRFLNGGALPPADAVRTEELINYFRFDYGQPTGDAPFAVTTELAPCPWNNRHRLALVGLQARALDLEHVPARNLVFLLDVSGSMATQDKLPLVRTAMRMLVDTLTERDRIAIVVYAGASGIVLPSTAGDRKDRIHEAIARLEAGGSTNGAAGITLAYRTAREQFVKGGINRVILATDGDFNVGVTSQGELTRLIEEQRASGIFLSVLGVGTGNIKDSTMELLADKGNGNYSYLDTLHEARKVLVREAGATLVTVAKDVKIQVEFNPRVVGAYRLIGYENRLLRNQDFNDDRKDAGEIGAGHTVTALYELIPPGEAVPGTGVDPLKYQRPAEPAAGASRDEVMTVKLRYKAPDGDESRLIALPVKDRANGPLTANVGFAAAVAEFSLLIRKSEYRGSASYADAAALARKFRGDDPDGYRSEFVKLVELADALARQSGTR